MTDIFTTSNGIQITETDLGIAMRDDRGEWVGEVIATDIGVISEYSQHKIDIELGRWRDPEDPFIVVYRRPHQDDLGGRCVMILDERSGVGIIDWEESQYISPSAKRYFEAHPIPEPKPWWDAKYGEAWVLTIDDVEKATIYVHGEFFQPDRGGCVLRKSDSITAGRRIWPEEENTTIVN